METDSCLTNLDKRVEDSESNLQNTGENCESEKEIKNEEIQEASEKNEKLLDNEKTVIGEVKREETEMKIIEKPEAEKQITSLAFLANAYDSSDSNAEDEAETVTEKVPAKSSDEETMRVATKNTTNDTRVDDRNEESKLPEIEGGNEYRNEAKISSSEEESEDSSEDSESSKEEESESEDSERTETRNERNRQKNQEKEIKGEFDDLPPIEELKISVPEVLCDPLGEVGWMVEQMVVVKPKPGKPTLNLDTILFVERGRRVLGRIFDVFGQVAEPHYCVRFNSSEHIKESDIRVGMTVYFCPNTEYTSVVFLQDLLKMKASEEIGDEEHPEFSDDEEERAYYAALRQRNEKPKNAEVPQKRQRTDVQEPNWKSNHPWNSRKRQQPKNTHRMHERPATQQQNSGSQPNWQNPYFGNQWPIQDPSYGGNRWQNCPQNPYEYGERYNTGQGNSRPFFRPPFSSSHTPYVQNHSYRPPGNSQRFPASNYLWQAQNSAPEFSWPVSSPPPPPPPPGM